LAINAEIALAPCIKAIYDEFYRVVLDEIVSEWSKKGVGLSQYDLYQKPNIRSKGRLNRAIKDLSACGYLVCVLEEARTRSPMGRKECYPTPLGILAHLLTSLLGYKITGVATFLAMYTAYGKLEELVLRCLPRIHRYLDYMDMAHRGSLYPDLDRGYATVIHALSVLRARVLSPLRAPAMLSRVPDNYVEFFAKELQFIKKRLRRELEEIIDDLEKSLEYLDESVRELRKIEELEKELSEALNMVYDMIHDLVADESLPPKPPKEANKSDLLDSFELKQKDLYKQVAEAFKLMQKTLEVHEKLQDKTQVSSHVN
jgi:exonuclease VII small subunit